MRLVGCESAFFASGRRKTEGPTAPQPAHKPGPVIDLMEALKQSMKEVPQRKIGGTRKHGRKREGVVEMQPYKGYLIEGTALLVHPFSSDWSVGGSVLVSGRQGSIVELARLQLHQFSVSMKELAEWFGLELAGIVVD